MPVERNPIPLFEIPSEVNSFDLFPAEISSQTDVVYHGTSMAYSEGIESSGFSIGHLPVDRAKVEFMVESFKVLGEVSDYDPNDAFPMKLNTLGRLEHYLNKITTNSFSPLSFTAARYASQPLVGGQIIKFISEAAQSAKGKLEAIGGPAVDRDIENCDSIVHECQVYREAQGVLYAVRVTPELAARFSASGNVLLSSVDIPLEHIVGKMIIPSDFVLPSESGMEKQRLAQKLIRDDGVAKDIYEQGGEEPEDAY